MSLAGEEVSLNIEESNKLRAKLGLKPLRLEAEEHDGAPAPGTGSMENDILLAPVLPGADQQANEVWMLAALRQRSTAAQ